MEDWIAAMKRGDFRRAWAISDRYLQRCRLENTPKHIGPRHLQTVWRGESLADARVLVRCYHGLGDTIQFIRFTSRLRSLARQVVVWAQPELIELLSTAPGIDLLLPLNDAAPPCAFDVDIEVMELAYALRIEADELAGFVPYLRIAASDGPPLSADKLNVGLVWQGGDWDRQRSPKPSDLSPLFDSDGIQFHSLTPGADLTLLPGAMDLSSPRLIDTARALLKLDLVLTVDTMMAHLAGALGLKVLVMLPTPSDWRWMERGEASPWYPTMRLFRQSRPGVWADVIERVGGELERTARTKRGQFGQELEAQR